MQVIMLLCTIWAMLTSSNNDKAALQHDAVMPHDANLVRTLKLAKPLSISRLQNTCGDLRTKWMSIFRTLLSRPAAQEEDMRTWVSSEGHFSPSTGSPPNRRTDRQMSWGKSREDQKCGSREEKTRWPMIQRPDLPVSCPAWSIFIQSHWFTLRLSGPFVDRKWGNCRGLLPL